MTYSPLPDSDLLLIIDMCDEGIEKCDLRAVAAQSENPRAATWNAQVRERYVHLKTDLLAEIAHRREATYSQSAIAQQPELRSKPDTDASTR